MTVITLAACFFFIKALLSRPQKVIKKRLIGFTKKIADDDRHSETRVLYRGNQDERDFDTWSMGFYQSNQSTKENLKGFHQLLLSGFRNDPRVDESCACKALLQFRDGSWRQTVET